MTATLGTMILEMPDRPAANIAVKVKQRGSWQNISWKEYYEAIIQTASAFKNIGLEPGDKVALMSNTRWEWATCDLAVMSMQGIIVPIYQNSTPEEVEYILNHSEAKIFVCENKFSLLIWRNIRERCPHVKAVVCFEIDRPEDDSVHMWPQFLANGKNNLAANKKLAENNCRKISLKDTATIVYTSGTTGLPKGVVLTYEQISSEITEAFPFCGVKADDMTLTFLPFAHVLGRIEHWGHVHIGFTMAYAESIEKIRYNLPEIKPTILVAVPRIFEKVYSQILSQIETQPLKKKIFNWAMDVGRKVSYLKVTRQRIPLLLLAEYETARKLVLNKVTEAFGGRLKFAISGGAPISQDLAQFFHAAGILILEGYGLTETTAAITVNTPYNYKFGSVGRPIGDVQLKIAEDGEILVKSKKVMKEYYNDPESTALNIKDGWFATGDIGQILSGGDLKITDRKKDLIKTAGGKYVAPQKIENLLKNNPLIAYILVHGDQEKYIVCLVTIDRPYVEKWAKEMGWSYNQWTDLIDQPEVQDSIKNTVNEANAKLASYESVKKYKILPVEFSIEAGEITPSLKVKRKFLDQKYKDVIKSLY
jgi:long-chain acyl-CoA synthetase